MYVEVFDELLTKKVTLESLLQVALRADYYLNVSEIGARVIAQSVRNETGKVCEKTSLISYLSLRYLIPAGSSSEKAAR